MSKQITSELLISDLLEFLKKRYSDFKGIYFFGSRRKGNFNVYSDYDLVLVFSRSIDWRFRKEILKIIYSFELEYDIFIDVKVYNEKDMMDPVTPFRQVVVSEGTFYAS